MAVAALRDAPDASLDSVLTTADLALRGGRGAAFSAARIDVTTATVEHACVGNVGVQLWSTRDARHLPCSPLTLGARRHLEALPRSLSTSVSPGELLVMFSDGVRSGLACGDASLLRGHPVHLAGCLMSAYGRLHDDATIVVVRA
jgi:hypothetical protein